MRVLLAFILLCDISYKVQALFAVNRIFQYWTGYKPTTTKPLTQLPSAIRSFEDLSVHFNQMEEMKDHLMTVSEITSNEFQSYLTKYTKHELLIQLAAERLLRPTAQDLLLLQKLRYYRFISNQQTLEMMSKALFKRFLSHASPKEMITFLKSSDFIQENQFIAIFKTFSFHQDVMKLSLTKLAFSEIHMLNRFMKKVRDAHFVRDLDDFYQKLILQMTEKYLFVHAIKEPDDLYRFLSGIEFLTSHQWRYFIDKAQLLDFSMAKYDYQTLADVFAQLSYLVSNPTFGDLEKLDSLLVRFDQDSIMTKTLLKIKILFENEIKTREVSVLPCGNYCASRGFKK
jgi:hypothetical protein